MPTPMATWLRPGILVMLLGVLCGCTRFEDHASFSRQPRSDNEWHLSWTTIARLGINLVDSSDNVGSASASFACRPAPDRPMVWLVDGPAVSWRGSGTAEKPWANRPPKAGAAR